MLNESDDIAAEISADIIEEVVKISTNQTAKKAIQILLEKELGFRELSSAQRRNLLIAFASRNMVIYGKAFDIVKTLSPVDLDSPEDIEKKFADIILYEIKSTNRDLDADFNKYFFALTTAELLVAQSLRNRYSFVFVNTVTKGHKEMTLREVFANAKGIYPTWSIQF